jgi:hypothetical protein
MEIKFEEAINSVYFYNEQAFFLKIEDIDE